MVTSRPTLELVASKVQSQPEAGNACALAGSWRAKPELLLSCGVLLLCTAYFSLFVDASLSSTMRTIILPGDVSKFVSLSEVFAHGIGAATILGVLLLAASEHRRPLLFAGLLTVTSGLVANASKSCFVRIRPHAEQQLHVTDPNVASFFQSGHIPLAAFAMEPDTFRVASSQTENSAPLSFWDARQRSFPSGHAATAWGLALGLSLAFPRASWIFGMLAISASVQRLTSGAHFPSDVLAGAALAFLCCAALLSLPLTRELLTQHKTLPSSSDENEAEPRLEVRRA